MHNSHITAGLGFKPQHFDAAVANTDTGMWFEVHPENYLVDGGPRRALLDSIRACHPVSLHGVSLSLAADAVPDKAHLARLAALVNQMEPVLVSEHLAWSAWRGMYLPDLLPFPRSQAALLRIASNIACTQDALGRRIAIENPSHYVAMEGHDWEEIDFLKELSRRTGCGLLLDINNVYISANNQGYPADAYIDAFPVGAVMEIHLAGHSLDPQLGQGLLIDSHDAPIAPEVWRLYTRLIARSGPRPTLIERDDQIPAFNDLLAERRQAHALLRTAQEVKRMNGTLASFQDDFVQSVWSAHDGLPAPLRALAQQPGFAVYRNTVMKGGIDALQANFPAVLRLVGEDWFRAVAALHVRAQPPDDARLLHYGRDFADFLQSFAPAAELPYLAGVARLDRFWVEAHAAGDAQVLAPAALAGLAPAQLGALVLQPHPAARWAWFSEQPIYTLWQSNRQPEAPNPGDELAWCGEGVLMTRPAGKVQWVALSAAGCAFLEACRAGKPLADAAAAALACDAQTDLAQLMATLLDAGAFGAHSIPHVSSFNKEPR